MPRTRTRAITKTNATTSTTTTTNNNNNNNIIIIINNNNNYYYYDYSVSRFSASSNAYLAFKHPAYAGEETTGAPFGALRVPRSRATTGVAALGGAE